jgi:hypothetical protein
METSTTYGLSPQNPAIPRRLRSSGDLRDRGPKMNRFLPHS